MVRRDSLLGIYSASTGVTHLIVALLVQDGVLDLDQAGPVGANTGFTMAELADDPVVAERLGAQRTGPPARA